jgi:hypothetical protein
LTCCLVLRLLLLVRLLHVSRLRLSRVLHLLRAMTCRAALRYDWIYIYIYIYHMYVCIYIYIYIYIYICRVVLEASYEATLYAAVIAAHR